MGTKTKTFSDIFLAKYLQKTIDHQMLPSDNGNVRKTPIFLTYKSSNLFLLAIKFLSLIQCTILHERLFLIDIVQIIIFIQNYINFFC